jgi:hypothetical protein
MSVDDCDSAALQAPPELNGTESRAQQAGVLLCHTPQQGLNCRRVRPCDPANAVRFFASYGSLLVLIRLKCQRCGVEIRIERARTTSDTES